MYLVPKLLVLIPLFTLSETSIRFTNVKCTHFDPDFAVFSECRLRMVKRNTVALNICVKLLQVPVTNVTVNLSLHKKLSGYRPFLYNVTMDYCKFERNRKKQPFAKVFYDVLLKNSNLNHTCPYTTDIIVDNLILKEDMLKYLPLPRGEYMFQLKVGAYNDWKADVKAYVDFNLSFAD